MIDVWVLRVVDGQGDMIGMDGYMFTDEKRAQTWIAQEYVRGRYRLSKGCAERKPCECKAHACLLLRSGGE